MNCSLLCLLLISLSSLSCASTAQRDYYEPPVQEERLGGMIVGPLVDTSPAHLASKIGSEMERYSVRHVRRDGHEFLQLIELGEYYEDDGMFKRRMLRLATEVELPIAPGQSLVYGLTECEHSSQPDASIIAIVTDSHGVRDESPTWACRVVPEAERFDLVDVESVRCRNAKLVR